MTIWPRLSFALTHEANVLDHINGRGGGWYAESWGQSLLSEAIRKHLKASASPIRWLPDIIAFAPNCALLTFEAKTTTHRTSPNWDIETASLTSAIAFERFARAPVYFVFDDLTVARPSDILDVSWDGPRTRNGSGTPYKLTRRSDHTTTLDDLMVTWERGLLRYSESGERER